MIHSSIRMTLPVEKVREAAQILSSMAERARFRSGCISSRVYHDVQEKCVIMIEEVWMSQEELERHLQSVEYRNVLLVLEMAVENPEIRFTPFAHSTGLETIENARVGRSGGENA